MNAFLHFIPNTILQMTSRHMVDSFISGDVDLNAASSFDHTNISHKSNLLFYIIFQSCYRFLQDVKKENGMSKDLFSQCTIRYFSSTSKIMITKENSRHHWMFRLIVYISFFNTHDNIVPLLFVTITNIIVYQLQCTSTYFMCTNFKPNLNNSCYCRLWNNIINILPWVGRNMSGIFFDLCQI